MIHFEGHTATVCSLAFSPDSMTLASGAKDGSVRLWDAGGELITEAKGQHPSPRYALAWSPNGDRIVTGHGQQLTTLRVGESERVEQAFRPLVGEVTAVKYLSATLAAVGTGSKNGGQGGTLHLWDFVSHSARRLPSPVVGVYGVMALTANLPTKRLDWIAGLPNTTACVWRSWCITSPNSTDVKLGKPATDIAVSPTGDTVAIASNWLVRVFNADGKPRTDLAGHKGQVSGVGVIHGGRTVVSASWDETVRFWDVATGQETARFTTSVGKLATLAVSPDGTRIAVAGTDGPIVLLDAE